MAERMKIAQIGKKRIFIPTEKDIEDMAKQSIDLINIECKDETDESEIVAALQDVDVVLPRVLKMTRQIMEKLPRCKALVFGSVGFDEVDVEAATDNNILVINNPAVEWCVEEVSNQAMVHLLACAKKLTILNDLTKKGRWMDAKAAQKPMVSIHGQTIGLVGCGSIGLMTGKKAQAFGMKVIGYDPYLDKAVAKANNITLMSLPELLKQADFVSVHTPLLDATYHLLSEKEFGMMKPSAYVINTARGKVIDEPALIKALQEKKIAGAGLDVFEQEPADPNNPLFKMDNVIVTPHCASYSDVAFAKPLGYMLRQSLKVIQGIMPKNVVNKSVKPKINLRSED